MRRGAKHGPKIASVRTYFLSCPLPVATASATLKSDRREALLVHVVAENGAEGWGEALGPPALLQTAIHSLFAPLLIGEDALQTDHLWHVLWRAAHRWERRGVLLAALSGVDMALWDLKGHALKRPVSEMMGGRVRDRLPCYATGLYFRDLPETDLIPSLIEEAQGYIESGFRAVKAQIGRNRSWDAALIRALRKALPDATLMADGANAYDLPEAMEMGRVLEENGFLWFEDPLSMEFPEQFRTLSDRVRVPLAAGEWEQTRWGFQALLAPGGVMLPQVNLAYCGGPTEAVRIRAIAASHGLNLVPSGMGTGLNLAAAAHLLASDFRMPGRLDPSPGWLSCIAVPDPFSVIFTPGVERDGGTARVPTGPGLGVSVDRDELKSFCIRDHETTA